MSQLDWLVLWLFGVLRPALGRPTSLFEGLREPGSEEDSKMAEDSSEIVREQSESVAAANLKTLGDGPAFYTNMGYANSIAHQQAMQQVQLAAVGKVVELIVGTSPSEGGADVAALQQLLKGAQTTPPTTA